MEIFLGVLFLIVCVLLIIVVLLQKGRGGGLGAAFGGAGQSAFGTRTGDVFTWVTIVLTGLFLVLAIGTTLTFRPAATEVPAPIIAPSADEITLKTIAGGKKIDVTLRAAQKDEIYYTTNGDEPVLKTKESSVRYDGMPFEVEPGTTVKAKAFHGTRASKTSEVRYPTEKELKDAAAAQAAAEAAMTQPAPDAATTQPATGQAQTLPTTTTATAPALN